MSEFIFPFSPDKHFGPGQLLSQHDGMRVFDLHHPTEFAAYRRFVPYVEGYPTDIGFMDRSYYFHH